MKIQNLLILTCAMVIGSFTASGQNAKKFYSAGKKLAKDSKYTEAIDQYTQAITADAKMEDAFIGRAEAYEKTNKLNEAVKDYQAVLQILEPTNKLIKEIANKAGADLIALSNYKDAQSMFDKTIAMDKSNLDALQQRALCKIRLHNFTSAVEDCDKAIAESSSNHLSYYLKAVATDSLSSYQISEMLYQKAVYYMLDSKSKKDAVDVKYKIYYVNLGTVQRKLNKLDDAMKNYNAALALDEKDDNIFYLRGMIFYLKNDFQSAIGDFTKSIVLNEKNSYAFLERGFANKKLGQSLNAITDFTRSIVINEKEPRAYQGRAGCNFEIAKFTEAMRDYEKAIALNPDDKELKAQAETTKQRIYEMNRESNNPVVILISPEENNKNKVNLPDNAKDFIFKGKIKDESLIKSVKIDAVEATFDKEALNPNFTATVPVLNKQQITITATDIYNNSGVEVLSIVKTETNPPVVKLTSPHTTPENEIYLTNENPLVFFEGQVTDASQIKSITVEGLVAGFDPNTMNPVFNTNVNILNKDTIKVVATDIFGNTSTTKFFIDRAASAAALSNPMGRTWAVFIDNSNYSNLPQLQGTSADVTKMRTSLAGYKVDKTIVKKDMKKSEMERFFSIELRDMLRDNMINSVMIWYSGHGKFMNDVGYWIPVDAVRDDEFSYFSLNSLKASILSYKNVEHHLVISDACETGPAFYLAMRDADKPKTCGQWDFAKMKSAQVLTSSNKEKSSDNSIFATSFASSLDGNADQCISIESIAEKVKAAVKKNQAQSPKFGNINGIEDAGGTFFFIKK